MCIIYTIYSLVVIEGINNIKSYLWDGIDSEQRDNTTRRVAQASDALHFPASG